jgi:hypothetical protein
MAVRVRVRIDPAARGATAPHIETVAVANSGFEAAEPEILLPVPVAERLRLWPPAPDARADRFESPVGALSLLTLPRAVRVRLGGRSRPVLANAVIAEREREVVLNDWLVDELRLVLVAVGRGLYRVGPRGALRRSAEPELW